MLGSHRRRAALAVTLALTVALGGCSRTGSVSGTVTYDDGSGPKNLPSGTIQFHSPKGVVKSGAVKDGQFSVEGVPAGPCQVTVAEPYLLPAMRPPENLPKEIQGKSLEKAPDPTGGKRVDLPGDFGDKDKSGLNCEVKGGPQKIDFNLPFKKE
jgi:hypothetical protein